MKKNQCKQLKKRPSGRFYEKRFLSRKRSSIIKQPSSDGVEYLFLKLSRAWPTMILIRRGFYLIAGFTFPGFWMIHASGYGAIVYQPIQHYINTPAVGWPSLITATLIYLAAMVSFEACWRLLKNTRP